MNTYKSKILFILIICIFLDGYNFWTSQNKINYQKNKNEIKQKKQKSHNSFMEELIECNDFSKNKNHKRILEKNNMKNKEKLLFDLFGLPHNSKIKHNKKGGGKL